ncbi:hypothetical protein FUA23_07150 [Neolewinella aurantiaca]|uniref:Uncharacterized protein n=1 Tax=Neolewinella aurantiaca TaxID=2602767 RepID=A0A5C7FXP1_9BACT|nr:hypothetical protein [Neolewinella aurantiaca]TXF90289.1 hypothetical protein FUA23_07150 [Neolewinella aurantiaca]
MTLEHKKYAIIQEIMTISQEDMIDMIEELVKKVTRPKYTLDLSRHANIKAKVDLEAIKKERPPVDFDMAEFRKEASELEWDKSIDELLQELD